MKRWLLFYLAIATALSAQADYRIFKLQFTNKKTKAIRTMESTLDPEQYKSIYGSNPDETLTYVQTWRCWGRTDWFKPHCQSPEVKPVVMENPK
ncbi:MAG: hypothetical protein H7256_14240 [Bdellovibrio sp.]|nr:hypothetical protein [Bdellovibrio sp.]